MQHAHRSGQTLIEAIAALGILVVGFLGILALLARSFATVRTISNETTATYLAAEGIELTKSVLDHVMFGSTVLNPSQWWWPCFAVTPGAAVDYGFDYSLLWSQGSCNALNGWQRQNQFLLFDPSTGLYGYTAGTVTTGFKRDINISMPANNPNEAIVISTVTWDGGASRVQLEDHFYNWLP